MKNNGLFWVAITSLLLLTVVIMVTMNFPFNWVFYITVIGQISIVFMVYRVLTDDYQTSKTFEDYYEDNPIGNRPN